MTAQRIGFIGLGAMGQGQAQNLIGAGFEVHGFDINAAAIDALVAAGGRAAANPADAAADAELLFVLVFNAEQAEAVLFGDDGATETLPAGATVVLHTTGAPEDAQRIAARLAEAGHPMLDAPVTGGKVGADEGILTAIVSGPDDAFEAAEPALDAMCRTVYRVGDRAGAASTVKMVNQLLVSVHAAAMAEAMTLATKAGADPKSVFDVITHGSGNSVIFERLVPLVLARDFTPRGAAQILIKDLGIVQDAARRHAVPLPLAAAALQQFLSVAALGHAEDDLASIIKAYETAAGVDVAQAAEK